MFLWWLRHGSLDLFEPIWLFTTLYAFTYLYRPGMILFSSDDFVTFAGYFTYQEPVILTAFLASVFGLLTFHLGYCSRLSTIVASWLPTLGDERLNTTRLRFVSIVGLAIGTFVLFQATPLELDGGSFLFNRDVRQAIFTEWTGKGWYMFVIPHMPIFALSYCYSISMTERPLFLKRLGCVAAVAIAGLSVSVLGGRIQLASLVLGLVWLYHMKTGRIGLPLQIVLGVAAAWGSAALGVILALDANLSFSPYDLLRRLSQSFDGFEFLVIAFQQAPQMYLGRTYVEDLLITFLPRALFPSKPVVYGTLSLQEDFLPGIFEDASFNATFPPGLLAEGFANFGPAGILVAPFAAGVLWRAIYEKGRLNGGVNLVIAASVASQTLAILRGLGAFFVGLIFTLFLLWLCYAASLRSVIKQRRPALVEATAYGAR